MERSLLLSGAEVNLRDRTGRTALIEAGHREFAELRHGGER